MFNSDESLMNLHSAFALSSTETFSPETQLQRGVSTAAALIQQTQQRVLSEEKSAVVAINFHD
jgi:hypothetical protein